MKILFVGHDIAYVHFYHAIESALRLHTELSALHIYSRPSAWFYSRFLLRLPSRSPSFNRLFGRWLSIQSFCNHSVDLRFYMKSEDAAQKIALERLYIGYFRFVKKITSGNEFDFAILPGEYRLFEQATIAALKSANRIPKIIYFEAGPPGYVYFDKQGVNANASFASVRVNQLVEDAKKLKIKENSVGCIKISSLMRKAMLALDVIWLWLAKIITGLLDLEEFWDAVRNRVRSTLSLSKKAANESDNLLIGPSIVFVGQVRNDINHTHFGINDGALEKNLFELLSGDLSIKLIWRDHPFESSDELYNRMLATFPNRVLRIDNVSLQQILAIVEGVVTVNSNGGLEALAFGLPVRLLGRSYFSKLEGVCEENLLFKQYREKVRKFGPSESIRKDAERFLKTCFLPINYRGNDFHNANLAAEVILACKT